MDDFGWVCFISRQISRKINQPIKCVVNTFDWLVNFTVNFRLLSEKQAVVVLTNEGT